MRHLPALGFLGLGPWYYDNGAVEITRADERHDRVDAVSRGMLGLTVGCARCHDHKYDPIPTKDYYALGGVFLNTEYHEYPLAPKAVVEERKAREEALEQKRELLREYTNTEARQLAGTLAFQAAKYMKAAWQVTGEPKKEKAEIIEKEKLDYELFDRWLAFLAAEAHLLSVPEGLAGDDRRGAARRRRPTRWPPRSRTLLVERAARGARARRRRTTSSRRGRCRAASRRSPRTCRTSSRPTTTSARAAASSCRSMTKDRTALYRDVFVVDLETDELPCRASRPKPGLLRFRGWGLEQRLGADRRALIEGLRKDIEAMEKTLPPKYAYVHGVRDVETPEDLKVHLRGSPMRLGDTRAARIPVGAEPRRAPHVHEGQRPPRTGADHRLAARWPCA